MPGPASTVRRARFVGRGFRHRARFPGLVPASQETGLSAKPTPPSTVEFDAKLIKKLDRPGPRYTSYPTADRFTEAFGNRQYALAVEQRKLEVRQRRLRRSLDVLVRLDARILARHDQRGHLEGQVQVRVAHVRPQLCRLADEQHRHARSAHCVLANS